MTDLKQYKGAFPWVDSIIQELEELRAKYKNSDEQAMLYSGKCGEVMAELQFERARNAKLVEALNQAMELVDTDNVKTSTENDEEEYWVNYNALKFICEEALAANGENK